MDDKTKYYQRNRRKILNRAEEYYENNNEILREQAKNRYRELSNEEKKYKKEIWKKQIS